MRAFYTSYQNYSFECAKLLHEQMGWQPVYWTTFNPEFEQKVKDQFPKVRTHNVMDALKCILPEWFNHSKLIPPDKELLHDMAEWESICLNMMNRNDLNHSYEYAERIKNYHHYLSFYSGLIEELKPDLLIMEDTPHQANTFILYQLFKRKGLKTIFFEETFVPGRIWGMTDYEEGSPMLKKLVSAAQDFSANQLLPETEKYIRKITGKPDVNAHAYMAWQIHEYNVSKSRLLKLVKKLPLLKKILSLTAYQNRLKGLLRLTSYSEIRYLKSKKGSFRDTELTNFEMMQDIKTNGKLKTANRKAYEQLSTAKPDLRENYIAFFLHYQPEKTSSPWGGHFVNQYLCIQMLLHHLPAGWKLYIKEHISQYVADGAAEHYRSSSFYKDLANDSRVTFVGLSHEVYPLIDNARAVASICGTCSIEAAYRNIPAIVFGPGYQARFGYLEGVILTQTHQELAAALQHIQNGYKPDAVKLENYTKALEHASIEGYVGGPSVKFYYPEISDQMNAEAHFQAIQQLLPYLNINSSTAFSK